MFWLYEEELPAGIGIARFGAAHLAYLAGFASLALCYAFFYRRQDAARRARFDRLVGTAVLFFALCEYGVTALLGHMSRYALPLHLCSIMFFLVPLHAWTKSDALRGFLGALVFHPGIPGALAALLFPDWLYYPLWNYLSMSSFCSHGLIFVYGASLLVRLSEACGQARLLRRDLKHSLLFLALGALAMYFFDRAAGTNYWFMAGPGVDSPFLGVWIRGGTGAYLAALALTALAVTALWYGLRYLLFVRGREVFLRKDGQNDEH